MNLHYDNYLTRKYAPLYKNRHAPMSTTCMCWGFSVGDGWFNLINSLSYYLCSEWLYANKKYLEIKDREGKLQYEDSPAGKYNEIITPAMIQEELDKVNLAYANVPTAVQVKEKFGGLRFYVKGPTTQEQEGAIRFAELMSVNTCEVCGSRGKLRRGNWVRTLCNEHEFTKK